MSDTTSTSTACFGVMFHLSSQMYKREATASVPSWCVQPSVKGVYHLSVLELVKSHSQMELLTFFVDFHVLISTYRM